MLDVEFAPGPSLLSRFRAPQEQRPSRKRDPYLIVLGSRVRVAIAQDRACRRDILLKFQCLCPSGVNVLYPHQRSQPNLPFSLVFTRLYPGIPTLNTRR
jgi:hypothetical protein